MTELEKTMREDLKILQENNNELDSQILKNSGIKEKRKLIKKWEEKVNYNLAKMALIIRYLEMNIKTTYIGTYKRPDGYNGDIATIHAVYDPEENKVIGVHPGGFYTVESCIPAYSDGMDTLSWMKSAYSELN